jgi:two-component system chemotaxis response regulator CheB
MKRILIIDDSPFTRRILKEIIEEDPEFKVIDTANNGIEGLKKALKLKPDLITVDLEMPEMDGFSFLRFLMAQQPTPTIVVSSLSTSENVFKAIELGALDFIIKPTSRASYQLLEIKKDLLFKIRSALMTQLKVVEIPARPKGRLQKEFSIVAIGASTGGPQAIQKILTGIQGHLNAAILIAQHMPEGFTKVFAERLDRITNFDVKEGRDGEIISPGTAYISPGGCNMGINHTGSNMTIKIVKKKESDIYVPSVNYLLESLIPVARKCLAIILTGMGSDGKKGSLKLKEAGAEIWAESQESAVIFGMPQEVIKTGIVDVVLPLWDIPSALGKKVNIYD